jgi:hypothetical protein
MRIQATTLMLAVVLLAPVSAYAESAYAESAYAESAYAESAWAESDWAFYGSASFDAVVLRPLGFMASLVGAGLFVPAALISVADGRDSLREAWRIFVVEPGKLVYTRPLGQW